MKISIEFLHDISDEIKLSPTRLAMLDKHGHIGKTAFLLGENNFPERRINKNNMQTVARSPPRGIKEGYRKLYTKPRKRREVKTDIYVPANNMLLNRFL